jgi:hypothetical protein
MARSDFLRGEITDRFLAGSRDARPASPAQGSPEEGAVVARRACAIEVLEARITPNICNLIVTASLC